jgi:hypothetical protein
MTSLTAAYLRSVLHYDPATGVFTRTTATAHCVKVGCVAGCFNRRTGYRVVSVLGKLYQEHRLAYLYMTGGFPREQIDHINGIRNDNRWTNLRASTNAENGRNRKRNPRNTSGHNGVHFFKSRHKWKAEIMVCGKHKCLGYFTDIADAISARLSADRQFGYTDRHGKLTGDN